MKDTASAPSSGVPGTFDQTLIDHVPVAVVATDHEARITHWNRVRPQTRLSSARVFAVRLLGCVSW